MSSEHEIIFSSLSAANNNNINNILEIGTYNGKNVFFYLNYFLYQILQL